MNWRMVAAHRLAQELEFLRAKAATRQRRRGDPPWHHLYDPHAATELGELIYNRMTRKVVS